MEILSGGKHFSAHLQLLINFFQRQFHVWFWPIPTFRALVDVRYRSGILYSLCCVLVPWRPWDVLACWLVLSVRVCWCCCSVLGDLSWLLSDLINWYLEHLLLRNLRLHHLLLRDRDLLWRNLVISDWLPKWLRWRNWIMVLFLDSYVLTSVNIGGLGSWCWVGYGLRNLINWRNHALINSWWTLLLGNLLTSTEVGEFLGQVTDLKSF